MNPEFYQQVKQVFFAACEREPQCLAQFLDQACADSPELRKEVESLLQHHLPDTLIAKSPDDTGPTKIHSPVAAGPQPVDSLAATEIRAGEPRPERFPPGTIVAGRYRIIGPLGRGGMGDVYRADDLKLAQAVALKFLSRSRSESPEWLQRYQNEVRLSRKVTHPNVLRVYDIGEAEGEVFISMEYVDGEDLASLLRRIGRLPGDKAVEIARQLCAGLGAAHDQGVLHRDLKPANVMIDGRGQVRVADFGIAALARHLEESGILAGTPAFMAPELFEEGAPSIRSDLYSLGIVLYQVVTGKDPFDGTLPHTRARDTTVIRPSAMVSDVDAALERVILQCLERDPKRRPESAYAVAAVLPGGDPLAAAMAAGETPSPNMVAAAGASAAMGSDAAVGYLAAGLAALCLVWCLADRTFFLPQAGLVKPPAVLADKAEHIINAMGSEQGGQEHQQGFAIDQGFLQYAADRSDRLRTWKDLPTGRPPAICFWYRAVSGQIAAPALGKSLPTETLPAEPGTVMVRLDGRGRLLQYVVTPDRGQFPRAPFRAVDWSAPFEMASLPMAKFRPVRPVYTPPMYADAVAAWKGTYPDNPEVPVRVEGASLAGRPVYFEVVPPWGHADWGDADEPLPGLSSRVPVARLALDLLAIISGSVLAWYNLRRGRGDHRGAGRLVLFILLLGLLDWLLGETHVAIFAEEVTLFFSCMARATLTAAIAWISYFAVEPYVRRYWPQIMITWSRVLNGKLRDPLVGHDVLIGGTCGILMVFLVQLDIFLPSWAWLPPPVPKLPRALFDLAAVLGLRYKLSVVIATLAASVTLALVVLLLMLALRVALRRPRLALGVSWALLTLLQWAATGCDASFPWLISSIVVAIAVLLLMRVGVLALIVSAFVWSFLISSPLTSDPQAWYAPSGAFAAVLVVAIIVYGFFTARGGRPFFWQRLLDS